MLPKYITGFGRKAVQQSKAVAVAAIVGVGLMTSMASAQFVPADMDAIVFPITLGSIAIAVGTAGASMIGLWATWKIGFKLVRKFIARMGSAT